MINQLFFELLRVAIGTQETLSRPPSKAEWAALYAMAKKQSLVGVCFAGVQKITSPQPSPEEKEESKSSPLGEDLGEALYLRWMGMAAKIRQRNEVVNAQCVEVQQMIEKEGFRTFIMKGQGNSALYRASYDNDNLCLLRQSGDIDIYLDGGFEKVNAFVQRTCPTKEINELEIHYHYLQDPSIGSWEPTEVEIHYRPFIMRNPIKNARLQRFFKEAMRFDNKIALPNNAGFINVPTSEFNLVHQMVHIAHHLYTDGIGFRQLMDYYFVLRTVQEVQEVQRVQGVIHELGLDSFASALMWVIAHVFANENQNQNKNFYPWVPCEKDGRMLLEEILKSGNFGHQDETKADLSNKWKSFWYVNGKTFRFWRFDYLAWFWTPLWRAYHFAWRKSKGFR